MILWKHTVNERVSPRVLILHGGLLIKTGLGRRFIRNGGLFETGGLIDHLRYTKKMIHLDSIKYSSNTTR